MSNPNKDNNDQKVVDVFQLITDRICSHLEQNLVPWRKSWASAGIPRNVVSKRPYSGVNLLLLNAMGFENNLFLTFKQLKTLGASVNRGEKAIPVKY